MALRLEIKNNKFRVLGQDFQTKWLADNTGNKKVMAISLWSMENGRGQPLFKRKEIEEALFENVTPKRIKKCVEYFEKSDRDFTQFLYRGKKQEKKLDVQKQEDKFRVLAENFQTSWFPDTPANRKVIVIILRSLCDQRGKPFFSYQQLSIILESSLRQAASSHCEDFRCCGEDFYKTLCRYQKMDDHVLSAITKVVCNNPLATLTQIAQKTNQKLSREDITEANVCCALEKIGYKEVRMSIKKALEKGKCQYKEENLIKELFEIIKIQAKNTSTAPVIPKSLDLNKIGARSVESNYLKENIADNAKKLFDNQNVKSESLSSIWHSPLGWKLIAFTLYYHGVSLSAIGGWMGVHKSTVSRWLTDVSSWARVWISQQTKVMFSGQVGIDEKWIKVGNNWWYLFAAVDCVTNYPLLVTLHPSNNGDYCKLFLSQLKLLGYTPKLIITDGWNAYPKAIKAIFPNAEHSLCIFHLLHSIFKRLRKAYIFDTEVTSMISCLFKTLYKRTVLRRIAKLKTTLKDEQVEPVLGGLKIKLPQVIKSVGSSWRPTTANCVERFFGRFDRLYRTKGAFCDYKSAQKHVDLFMLGYLFSIRADGYACPLEKVGLKVEEIPFYHLFNRPNLIMLKNRIADLHTFAA